MCWPRKYPYVPSQKGLEFHGDGGRVYRTKTFKKCTKLDWKSSRDGLVGGRGGILGKNPFCGGGMDIFWNCTKITLRTSIKSTFRDLKVTAYMRVINTSDKR